LDLLDQLDCAAQSAGRESPSPEPEFPPIPDIENDSDADSGMAADSNLVMVTADKAGDLLGVKPSRVGQLIRGGHLPGLVKAGRSWLVPRASVEALKALRPERRSA
jgi:hypothetical protein